MSATRRGFLAGGAVAAAAAGAAAAEAPAPLTKTSGPADNRWLDFHGVHQGGIATPPQAHTYFAAFDLTAETRAELAAVMAAWTEAAARMTRGQPAVAEPADPAAAPSDSGEASGLAANRLTLTFGFGPTLFVRDGQDRYGLAARRPEALVDLPRFAGDQLVPARTGGDLSVQACSDDPQAAFHAVRQLARIADGKAQIRWVQSGFVAGQGSGADSGKTPRNLMGFKDGSSNVPVLDPQAMARLVWVGQEGGDWMQGGTYQVARPIRIALEHWDRMKLAFQEQTIGRRKDGGAPIGGKAEFDRLNLDAVDHDGNPLIADSAHVRLAAAEANDGAQILRRAYSYENGVNIVAERWPPWRQGLEYDAGLLFICYQRDPRTGFIKLFDRMSKFDMLNQFATHVGGGLFACPGGAGRGRYIGQALLQA